MKQCDFYAREGVSPFRRDLSDRERYFQQRDSLLRHLGIVPRLLGSARILELGPGHGENALFLLRQRPAHMVLVEVNEECVRTCEDLLGRSCPEGSRVDFHHRAVEDFETEERFDLVVFEGVIPFEPDPGALLSRASTYVADGGILSVTCIDAVSLFAEALRRLIGLIAAPPELDADERVQRLTPIFRPHLATLGGMTRTPEHWVLDQMVHPWSGRAFSILEAARTLSPEFDPYGTSPAFLTDWRWFRDVHGDRGYLELAERAYYENLHNLIDYRFALPARDPEENRELLALCNGILDEVRRYESEPSEDVLDSIEGELEHVVLQLGDGAAPTRQGLEDYHAVLSSWRAGRPTEDFRRFAPLFGRGQQYASFLRSPSDVPAAGGGRRAT